MNRTGPVSKLKAIAVSLLLASLAPGAASADLLPDNVKLGDLRPGSEIWVHQSMVVHPWYSGRFGPQFSQCIYVGTDNTPMADGRELNLELPIGARLRISSIEVLDYAVMLYLPHDGPDALISAIQCSKGGWLGFSNTEGRELTVGDLRQGLDLKAWVEGSASAQ